MALGLGLGLNRGRSVVQTVDALPSDASKYGPVVRAPRYPVVPTPPATVVKDQRWLVGADASSAVEVLGRRVAELGLGGELNLPVLTSDLLNNDWSLGVSLKDTNPGMSILYDPVFYMKNTTTDKWAVSFEISETNRLFLWLRNSDGGNYSPSTIDEDMSIAGMRVIALSKIGHTLHWSCNANYGSIDLIGWTPVSVDRCYFVAFSNEIAPIQVCNITQSLNGVSIDNIPCDDVAGTNLQNTVSIDRPATRNNPNATALAWVSQPTKTYATWAWKGIFRNAGNDWINCGRPAWLNQLRPSVDAFTIVSRFSKAGTDWGRIVCLGPTAGNFDQFAIVCAGAETQNQINALVGGQGSWTNNQLPAMTGSMVVVLSAFGLAETKTFLNGSLVGSTTTGNYLNGTDSVFIGSATGGGDNFEGDICCMEIYAGANADGSLTGLTLIDRYDFNAWDGSGSGVSEKGYPFTVSAGAPFTEKSFTWVPL